MASTYSALKFELIGTGEQSGTWGNTTNTNLGTAIEEAIVGYATANFTSDANLTISLTDTNASQTARNLVLNVTSSVSLTATRNLIVPTIEKPYYIFNNTTGSQSIVVKTSAGTGVTVPNGSKMFVYVDETNVVEAVNRFGSLTLGSALPVGSGGTGASSLTANNVILGNGTSAVQFVAPGTTGNVLTSNGTTWVSTSGLASPLAVTGNASAGAEIRLPEDTDNGSNYVALKAADNIGSNITFTLPNADGTNGQVIQTNGSGVLSFVSGTSLASPLAITGNSTAGAEIRLPEDTDNGSNYVALKAADNIGSNITFTLPATDGTNGQVIQTNGSGVLSFVSGTSLASPLAITGNSTAGAEIRLPEDTDNGSNYVALKAADNLAANVTFTLPNADGTNGQFLQTNGSGILSWSAAGSSVVQYPQESKSANYTLVLGDAGKQIFHPASDTAVRTFTIPANSSVAFPIGTVVLFTVDNAAKPITVAITSDTLVTNLSNTGSVNVAAGNTLYCIKVTSTKWLGYYLYQSAAGGQSIAVVNNLSPRITAYPWSGSGFGTKFADPGTLPTGNAPNVAFSPAGNAIAAALTASPYITAYPWSGSGFGTKFADPGTLPTGTGYGVAFSPAGNAIAVSHNISPFITAYPWSGSGFGTKFADPGTLPTGTGRGLTFSPAGDAIAVALWASPWITAYPWSGSGFGTKFADPGTLPNSFAYSVAFSPAGDAIAVAHFGSPYITAYPWSGSGFGTKFANPGTLPTGLANGVAFSPAGNAIAVAHDGSPYITAYPWSGSGFGTKFADPGTLPTNTGRGVAFSPAGDAIAVAHDGSPYITAYPWSGSGFGTKFADPGTLPTNTGRGVAFSPAGDAIAVAHDGSPYITAYPWSGSGFGTKFANPGTLPTFNPSGVAFTVN